MKLLSVNIGKEQTLQRVDKAVTSGIFKLPVSGRVYVGKLGIEGDVIVDQKSHGGPDQAAYIYGGVDYNWWRAQLGRDPVRYADVPRLLRARKR